MSNLVETDFSEVDKTLDKLSDAELVSSVINEGLEAMGEAYYRSILSSLRTEMGSAADTPSINPRYNFTLSSGVRKHPDKPNMIFGVHALTDFRLKFFEGGTRPRYTKGHRITGYADDRMRRLKRTGKGGYRGFIEANKFFSKGIDMAEETALQTLVQTINNALRNRGIDIS